MRQELAAQESAFTERWLQAVRSTSFTPVNGRELVQRFRELTGQLLDAVCATPVDEWVATAAGAELANLHLVRPAALTQTVQIFLTELPLWPSLMALPDLHERLARVVACLTGGYGQRVLEITLAEQESLHGALLEQQRQSAAAAGRLNSDLELRVAQRTAQLAVAARELTEEVARRRRIQEERSAALQREESARQQLALLDRLSHVLNAADDYSTTLQHIVTVVVPALADWCTLDLLGRDGVLRRVAVAHTDPLGLELVRELQRRYPPDVYGQMGIRVAIERRQPVLQSVISDAFLERGTVDADQLALLRAIGGHSLLCVPLMVRDRILGAMSFVSISPQREYTVADLPLCQEIAQRSALAIECAWPAGELVGAKQERDHLLALARHGMAGSAKVLCSLTRHLEALRAPADLVDGEGLLELLKALREPTHELERHIHHLHLLETLDHSTKAFASSSVNLSDLLGRVCDQCGISSARGRLETSLPQREFLVSGSALHLERALALSLEAVVKHAPGNKALRVRVRQPHALEVCVVIETVSGVVQNGGGGGPSGAALPHSLLELGLEAYIAQQFLKAHGGSLVVKTPASGECQLMVTLPLQTPLAAPSGDAG
ncbi:MAG: GAF domain-containing protein [Chloroflexi bacterium]|nr:GAF domain-containing protein [Chloroflexota bacterium]